MAPRLKVFTWSDGFHAFTVAASSRPKALAAWGMERDIFAGGLAHEIAEGPDHEAALERPGEVIERRLAVDAGPAGRRRPARKAGSPPAAKPAGPSRAARERVSTLERELDALDRSQAAERRELEKEAARIARALDLLARNQRKARDRVAARLETARKALRPG